MRTKKHTLGESGFWAAWLSKLLFTLISVKVWGLIAATTLSTWLLFINLNNEPLVIGDTILNHGINGAQWVTFNTTVWGIIFGMKEIFRIYELKDSMTNREGNEQNSNHKNHSNEKKS